MTAQHKILRAIGLTMLVVALTMSSVLPGGPIMAQQNEQIALAQSSLPAQEPTNALAPTPAPADTSVVGRDQRDFYYADGQRIYLTPSSNEIAVRFLASASEAQQIAQNIEGARAFTERTNIPNPSLALLRAVNDHGDSAAAQALGQLPAVAFANPTFVFPDGTRFALTDEFIVKFKNDVTRTQVDSLNAECKVEIVSEIAWLPGGYVMRITPTSENNTLDMANLYHENELTEWAEPNFVRFLPGPTTISNDGSLIPDDTFFPWQWAHRNTGENGWMVGADIDTDQAWDISTGSGDITIAIIDDGVDTRHEDLLDNLVTGYDVVDEDNDPNPYEWDAHGTACAGIAAGVGNNNKGIAGVCWHCKIMPIRIAYSPAKGEKWVTCNSWVADGINYAWQQGADILSNSWVGGSPSTLINHAIRNAKNKGRNGRGAVVVFASGNDDSSVHYPATLDEVIAVGASSPCDERKNLWSCDGEGWWGSNYGPELDVVAPGVKIYTTDIMGSSGYRSGNYCEKFNGTSSAAPHVAGLAGLVLSVDSNLMADQVQSLIENTADDVNGGGRDDELGHGRINARAALLAVLGQTGLRIVPASLQITGSGTNEVQVDAVPNPYGIYFRLTFDPNVVQVVDADPNTPGSQIAVGALFDGHDYFVAHNQVDNTTGVIEFMASLRAPAPPINGTGAVVTITWQAKSEGQSALILEQTKLSDPGGGSIPHRVENGTIQVIPTESIHGTVLLQSRDDHSGTTIFLSERPCPSSSTAAVIIPDLPSVVTDARGHFEIVPYAGGTYQCLQAIQRGYLVGQKNPPQGDLGTITLLAGDVTEDDLINIFDLALIAGSYRSDDPTADVNADGVVDIFDLSITAGNYGKAGPVTDWRK